jgi:hypothetical protein
MGKFIWPHSPHFLGRVTSPSTGYWAPGATPQHRGVPERRLAGEATRPSHNSSKQAGRVLTSLSRGLLGSALRSVGFTKLTTGLETRA